MGNVRIVTGRAGCGKTDFCIRAFVSALQENRREDGSSEAYLIVPEQFAVDYERKVLEHPDCRGLLGGEVLSFHRFAHRILTEGDDRIPEMLSPPGKAMLLVRAVTTCGPELQYYKRCAENAKSIAGLLDTVNEFAKYCVTPDMIEAASERSVQDATRRIRLHELALIYKKYSSFFTEEYSDVGLLYRKAANRIRSGAVPLSGAVVWVDSFSGFTELEMLLLKAIADGCSELNLCLFYDREENLIFHCPNKTCLDVLRTFRAAGHTVTVTDLQQGKKDPDYAGTRFAGCEAIGFLEKNFGRMHAEKKAGEPAGITVTQCPESYREIESCAREIQKLAAGGTRYRDIAVVDAAVDQNAALYGAIFSRLSVPFFLDVKRDFSGHPVVRFLFSFLDIVSENLSSDLVFGMLKTGLYKPHLYSADSVDLLENLAVSYGVNSRSGWTRLCNRLIARYGTEHLPVYGRLALDVRDCLYGENGFLERVKGCANVADCCRALTGFARDAGLEESVKRKIDALEKEGQTVLSETYARVWNVVTELIGQATLFIGEVKIRGCRKLVSFFADALRGGLSVCKIGFIPHTAQCVQIGNADRSRYLDKKAVFVIGANNGSFPSGFVESGVLGDGERALLKECGASLAYDSFERTCFAQYNVYSVLTSPSERLYISYSACKSDGSELLPSPCLASLQRIFPDLSVRTEDEPAEEPEKSAETEALPEEVRIDKRLAARLLRIGAECRMSISAFEKYGDCPYSFFIQYGLGLKERESGEVQNLSAGSYFHGLIEYALQSRSFRPGAMARQEASRLVRAASDAFFAEEGNARIRELFDNSAKNEMLRERIEEFAAPEVIRIAQLAEQSGFLPIGEECAFGDEAGCVLPPVKIPCEDAGLLLHGKIDRLDMKVQDGTAQVCVVDYKTKNLSISKETVERGEKLQLFAYYLVLKDLFSAAEQGETLLPSLFSPRGETDGAAPESYEPAAVLYYSYGKDTVKTGESEKKKHVYSGLMAADGLFPEETDGFEITKEDLAALSETARGHLRSRFDRISSGAFPIAPDTEREKDVCGYCHYRSICRYKGTEKRSEEENDEGGL